MNRDACVFAQMLKYPSEKSTNKGTVASINQISAGVVVARSGRISGYASAVSANPTYKPVQREQTAN